MLVGYMVLACIFNINWGPWLTFKLCPDKEMDPKLTNGHLMGDVVNSRLVYHGAQANF